MRIAPKPTAGQEISLDNLLKKSPVLGMEIYSSSKPVITPCQGGWTISPVHSMSGPVAIDLIAGPKGDGANWEDSAKKAGPEYRLIAADEFYGILHLMSHIDQLAGSAKASDPFRVWLNKLWIWPIVAYSSIITDGRGNAEVVHREGIDRELQVRIDLNGGKNDIASAARSLFGEPSESEFYKNWTHNCGLTPTIGIEDDFNNSRPARWTPYIWQSRVELSRSNLREGRLLLVHTKPIKVTK